MFRTAISSAFVAVALAGRLDAKPKPSLKAGAFVDRVPINVYKGGIKLPQSRPKGKTRVKKPKEGVFEKKNLKLPEIGGGKLSTPLDKHVKNFDGALRGFGKKATSVADQIVGEAEAVSGDLGGNVYSGINHLKDGVIDSVPVPRQLQLLSRRDPVRLSPLLGEGSAVGIELPKVSEGLATFDGSRVNAVLESVQETTEATGMRIPEISVEPPYIRGRQLKQIKGWRMAPPKGKIGIVAKDVPAFVKSGIVGNKKVATFADKIPRPSFDDVKKVPGLSRSVYDAADVKGRVSGLAKANIVGKTLGKIPKVEVDGWKEGVEALNQEDLLAWAPEIDLDDQLAALEPPDGIYELADMVPEPKIYPILDDTDLGERVVPSEIDFDGIRKAPGIVTNGLAGAVNRIPGIDMDGMKSRVAAEEVADAAEQTLSLDAERTVLLETYDVGDIAEGLAGQMPQLDVQMLRNPFSESPRPDLRRAIGYMPGLLGSVPGVNVGEMQRAVEGIEALDVSSLVERMPALEPKKLKYAAKAAAKPILHKMPANLPGSQMVPQPPYYRRTVVQRGGVLPAQARKLQFLEGLDITYPKNFLPLDLDLPSVRLGNLDLFAPEVRANRGRVMSGFAESRAPLFQPSVLTLLSSRDGDGWPLFPDEAPLNGDLVAEVTNLARRPVFDPPLLNRPMRLDW